MGMILCIASSHIVGKGDVVGSGCFKFNLSANSVMRGRVNAIRTFKGLVVDLRGIYDTKGGITASSQDTHDKANELQRRIKILNGWNRENIRYIGGIVCKRNGMWMLNKEPQYSYQSRSMDEWEQM